MSQRRSRRRRAGDARRDHRRAPCDDPAAISFDSDASAIIDRNTSARARADRQFFRVAGAIDRTGSTDPAAIEKALQAASSPTNLIVGHDGVLFDAAGQNTLAATYLIQFRASKSRGLADPRGCNCRSELRGKGGYQYV